MPAAAATLAASAKSANAEPEWHTFTDTQGRTLNAQVLSLVDVTANLKREDGTTFTAPLSTFSKADQAFIVETQLKQRLARKEVIFEFSAVPFKADQISQKITGGTRINWREYYRVSLKNQTFLTLADLQVRAIVFKALLLPDVPGVKTTPIILLGQTINLAQAPAHGETTIQTDPNEMQQILANEGGYFPGAATVHAESDKLLAVWVRVYDSNNFLVQEWCSNNLVMKQQPWDDAWAQTVGQARSARGARGGK